MRTQKHDFSRSKIFVIRANKMLSKPRGYYILTGLEFTTHSFYKQHFYKQHQARFGKKLSQSQANLLTF